jgi:mannose-6-phosphate isomerase-like protein (cupin superfamily)
MPDLTPQIWDLAQILHGDDRQGPVWSYGEGDLDINLVLFRGGDGVGTHTNNEVDVLGIILEGEALLEIEGEVTSVHGGQAFYVPKGARRSIRSAGDRVAYLTCHRRRGGLKVQGLRGF